jgi:hypothetical protein
MAIKWPLPFWNHHKLKGLAARRIVAILDGMPWADAFSVATLPDALKLQGCFDFCTALLCEFFTLYFLPQFVFVLLRTFVQIPS